MSWSLYNHGLSSRLIDVPPMFNISTWFCAAIGCAASVTPANPVRTKGTFSRLTSWFIA